MLQISLSLPSSEESRTSAGFYLDSKVWSEHEGSVCDKEYKQSTVEQAAAVHGSAACLTQLYEVNVTPWDLAQSTSSVLSDALRVHGLE